MGGFILGQKVKQELPLSNNDTIKPKTWQKMTITEKASKKNELLKQGGMPRFLEYKDSISTDATNRRETDINKTASEKGMTRVEYEKWYKKNKNKPDAPVCNLNTEKSDGGKGSCTTGNKADKRTTRDIR